MVDALTNFGLMFEAKEDARLEAYIQLNLKIVEMNILAKERAVQARIEAEERMVQACLEAKERMAKRAEEFKLWIKSFRKGDPR